MAEQRLIDANAFDNRVRVACGFAEEELSDDFKDGVMAVLEMLKRQPTIEERKKGKWERHNTYHGDDISGFVDPDWRCSECGGQANVNIWSLYDLTDFCPNCGADMRGEKHETD